MLKYELKKYILKPSLLICIIVLILLNFVKVFELYYYTGGAEPFFREMPYRARIYCTINTAER